ncbi:hypothetical protein GJ699_29050 [Duganella sp. FT80W]|uniref:Uncharacterized protein n=1 Tax=Duganella guangzhouensis TaxID=2666084 RepID=A0A6I2L722_9BURK|nr:hypothetical protein [Duganella guangzhouensis]MRW94045.1 hypothetical protein [Duganella guangzhouensis]
MRMLALMMAMTAAMATMATAAAPASLRHDHPVIGIWRITLPDGSCSETYRIRADGTTLVFSNEEVAESSFTIEDQPDKNGFYKEVDTIVKDNGKRDCSGEITKPGKPVTSYLKFHPGGDMFLMCAERNTQRCLGPFMRVRGKAI